MTAARQHDRLSQLRNELRQVGNELIHAPKPHDEVSFAGQIERGNVHKRSGKRSEQLPVAIDVAVPVEPAAKSGASEFAGE